MLHKTEWILAFNSSNVNGKNDWFQVFLNIVQKKKKCNQTIVFPILIYLVLNLENPALKNRGQIN